MRQDQKKFSNEQLEEIESLYQIANKKWQSPEARACLEKLVEKYDKANRTGCAVLYLGQMSTGDEKEKYLKKAIADHGDCFYGDGVQVGAFARFLLGHVYLEKGEDASAKRFFDEIRKDYPDAIDHFGDLLIEKLPELEKTQSVAEDEHADVKKKAVEAAEAWLAVLDRGEYEQNWETAAAYFKNVVSKESLVNSLSAARKPMGKLVSRKLHSAQYMKQVPGAPDGEYVILLFESSFEDKASAMETVTPMLDKDGAWRVSGYYIK